MFWVQLVECKDERTTVNIVGQDSALRTILLWDMTGLKAVLPQIEVTKARNLLAATTKLYLANG